MPLDQQRFIKEALDAHNDCRSRHGVAPLEHNPELTRIALEWAKHIASRNSLSHSKNDYNGQPLGENCAMWFSTGATHYDGKQATMQWYNEIEKYDYSNPRFVSGTGHFTQVVWKNSKQVGFGFAQAKDGSFYAVGNYFPAGNYQGQFKEMVPPLIAAGRAVPSAFRPAPIADEAPKTRPSASTSTNKAGFSVSNPNSLSQDDFIHKALVAHIKLRKLHNAPMLKHNPELSRMARKWAETLASDMKMRRSDAKYNGEPLGENIAFSSSKDFNGEYATMQWYNTKAFHDFNKTFNEKSGLFTQLIWKDTTDVGFGVAKALNGHQYAVAYYYPAGNYEHNFKSNVSPAN